MLELAQMLNFMPKSEADHKSNTNQIITFAFCDQENVKYNSYFQTVVCLSAAVPLYLNSAFIVL